MSSSFLSRRVMLAGMGVAMMAPYGVARADGQVLRIGIIAGEDEDVWRVVAENAAKEGLTLKIIPFSDYNAPNEALAEHELDANAFQHGPFLEAQNKAKNFHIVPVGNTYLSPIGLYSRRWKSVAELPNKAVIGVPNDPTNEGARPFAVAEIGADQSGGRCRSGAHSVRYYRKSTPDFCKRNGCRNGGARAARYGCGCGEYRLGQQSRH